MLAALESMGFPTTKCAKAIRATGSTSVENATNWLFEHLEDPEDSVGTCKRILSRRLITLTWKTWACLALTLLGNQIRQ